MAVAPPMWLKVLPDVFLIITKTPLAKHNCTLRAEAMRAPHLAWWRIPLRPIMLAASRHATGEGPMKHEGWGVLAPAVSRRNIAARTLLARGSHCLPRPEHVVPFHEGV